MIGQCKNCTISYCMECSPHENWEEFCSDECEQEFIKELEKCDQAVKSNKEIDVIGK